jgi:hypothetical protein
MRARINTAIGRHWGNLVGALDIVYVIAAFGALGSLPLLGGVVANCAGRVRKQYFGASQRTRSGGHQRAYIRSSPAKRYRHCRLSSV